MTYSVSFMEEELEDLVAFISWVAVLEELVDGFNASIILQDITINKDMKNNCILTIW